MTLALAVAVVLHAVFVAVLWHELRPRASVREVVHMNLDDALQVRLIQHVPAPAAAPSAPPPPPPEPSPRKHPHEAPAKDALTVTAPPPPPPTPAAPPATLQLYDRNGQTLLPTAAGSTASAGYVQRAPQGDAQVMRGSNVVNYQPTRFDQGWGKGGGAVTRALNKAVEKTTVTHTFHPLPGVRIHCAVSLAMLAGGCGGDPPSPPSAKDGDQRLNMAPASALAKDPHPTAPAPSVDECIAQYRAGQPLPYGCPVDTPSRAVDAELRECIAKYRAGKYLGANCPSDIAKRAAQADAVAPAKP